MEEVKDFEEMGAVNSGICLFFFGGGASKFRFISGTGMAHGGAAWKNCGSQWN